MLSKDFLELKLRKSNSNPSPAFDPLFHPYESLSSCFSLLFHNELQQTSPTNSYISNFLISLFISSISRQQERNQPGHPRPLPCLSNLLAWHGAGAWRAQIRPPAAQYPSRQHCRSMLLGYADTGTRYGILRYAIFPKIRIRGYANIYKK